MGNLQKMSGILNQLIEQSRAQEDKYDAYRDRYEDTKHWYCRKEFIRHNWDRFFSEPDLTPEQLVERKDKLDCRSRVWANMHFMGTSYPIGVTKELTEMSFGMAPISVLLKDGEALAKRLEKGLLPSKRIR